MRLVFSTCLHWLYLSTNKLTSVFFYSAHVQSTLKADMSNDILKVQMKLSHHLRIFVSFMSTVRQITRWWIKFCVSAPRSFKSPHCVELCFMSETEFPHLLVVVHVRIPRVMIVNLRKTQIFRDYISYWLQKLSYSVYSAANSSLLIAIM